MLSEYKLTLPAEGSVYRFAGPLPGDDDGFVGMGGDLSPQCLVDAYGQGCFPWYRRFGEYHWYSPNPRMVLFPKSFRCHKSLTRVIKSGKFEVRIDTRFRDVITMCATVKRRFQSGTWIGQDYIEAYTKMHEIGLAHSFETYQNGELVGGLYGLSIGSAFFGESMFHTVSDASKVALARLVDFCLQHNIGTIDTQQVSSHSAFMGAIAVPRTIFLKILSKTNHDETLIGKWTDL